MRVALATCESPPDSEIDDRHLHEALAARGVHYTVAAWTDASVDWSSFDACLLRTTWDYHERRGEFLLWAERVAAATRLFNPFPIVKWNTHKSYLRDLAGRGVPIAPTVWLTRGAAVSLGDLLAERGWTRAFIKPAVGASAWRTMRFDAKTGLKPAQAHADALLAEDDVLLQPYLARVETDGELSVIFIDGEPSHAVRKVPVPGDYRTQDDFGAHDEPAPLDASLLDVARRALRAAGDRLLYARADFLRAEGGSLVLTELELVEPSLFFRHNPGAAQRLAAALCQRLA